MPTNEDKKVTNNSAEKPKAIVRSSKQEVLMYTILFLGLFSIISLFAINIALIDKMFDSLVAENLILKDMLSTNTVNSSNLVELREGELIVTVTPVVTDAPEPTAVVEDATVTPTVTIFP